MINSYNPLLIIGDGSYFLQAHCKKKASKALGSQKVTLNLLTTSK